MVDTLVERFLFMAGQLAFKAFARGTIDFFSYNHIASWQGIAPQGMVTVDCVGGRVTSGGHCGPRKLHKLWSRGPWVTRELSLLLRCV